MISMGNVIALSSIRRAGATIDEKLGECIDLLSTSLHEIANTSGGDYEWRKALMDFQSNWLNFAT